MHEHALRGEIEVGRELVGVPAEQQVARVGVDRAERSGGGGDFQLVLIVWPASVAWLVSRLSLKCVEQIVFAAGS